MAASKPETRVERWPDMRASAVLIEYTDGRGYVHSIEVMCGDSGEVGFRILRQTQQEQDQRTATSWNGMVH